MGRAESPLRDRMIFVVGARRSGTNWLQRTLGAHPEILVVPSETYLFSHGIAPLAARFHAGTPDSTRTGGMFMEPDELADAARDFCDRAFCGLRRSLAPDAERVVERTPWHAHCLDLIGRVYPDSWVLHLIRDGRDVARSLVSQPWGPRSVAEAAEEWRMSVEAARSAGQKPARYREIRYEDLLADAGTTVADLLGWIGVAADPTTLEAVERQADVRFNVDPAAPRIGSGKWMVSFTEADREAFNGVAGGLLAELGYGRAPDAEPASERAEGRPEAGTRPRVPRLRRRRSSAGISLEQAQIASERLLTRIREGRSEEASALLSENALVSVIGEPGVRAGRGQAGRDLVADLAADPAFRAPMIYGRTHVSLPTSVTIEVHDMGGGIRATRSVAVTASDRGIVELEVTDPSWSG